MGLGFTLSITCIGAVRELLGAGQLFGRQILPLADAACRKDGLMSRSRSLSLRLEHFFVLAMLAALQNKFKIGCSKERYRSK